MDRAILSLSQSCQTDVAKTDAHRVDVLMNGEHRRERERWQEERRRRVTRDVRCNQQKLPPLLSRLEPSFHPSILPPLNASTSTQRAWTASDSP